MQLTPFCLMLTCLRVSPDRSQFFRYDTISLSCVDRFNGTSWTVKRNTSQGGVKPCSSGWGAASSGSSCNFRNIYPTDSGVYWCESAAREHSNAINIIITDGNVILDSPALPVSEGTAVTLKCHAPTKFAHHRSDFYKDERPIGSSSTGKLTVHNVSKADEGLYKCSVSGAGESPSSWLAVEASPPTSATPTASCLVSVVRLTCQLLVVTPYLLSTILLGLICRDRRRAWAAAKKRRSSNVVMEIVA